MAHILVVDDDDQVRLCLSEFIGKLGHEVAVAADGAEALRYITAHAVDLVLLDIIMPEQDGFGVIVELMRLPKRPAIIALSGGSLNLDLKLIRLVAKKLPIEEFLRKPICLETLGIAIAKALAARKEG